MVEAPLADILRLLLQIQATTGWLRVDRSRAASTLCGFESRPSHHSAR